MFCREEEEGARPDIYGAFQGRVALLAASRNHFPGRLMPPAAPENRVHFQGRLMT